MLLRGSEFKQASSYDSALKLAKTAKGEDTEGVYPVGGKGVVVG